MGRLTAAAAVLCGGAGLVLFGGFLWRGAPGWLSLGLAPGSALAWDAGLSLLFFLQHSGLVRSAARKRMPWPERYHGAIYAATSGLALLVVVGLWQPVPGFVLVPDEGPARWGAHALFAAGAALGLWGGLALRGVDFFGLAPLGDAPPPATPFTVRGPYRLVRHPLYTASLLLIWGHLPLTADRLLFDLLWTAWIVVATVLEERDLVARFGDDYRRYQQTVPMLWPRRRPAPS